MTSWGELLIGTIFPIIAFGCAVLIDKNIVQRRDTIVQLGRQAQRRLHVAKCIRIFSETDPEILKEHLRDAVQFLGLASFFGFLGVVMGFVVGTLWNPMTLLFLGVFPNCIALLVWLGLVLARRKMEKGDFEDDREDPEAKGASAAAEGWNPGLRRTFIALL
ncbi:hypothetical protein F4811DRAFT_574630 [Daldinia bambusicola]|nr:hypothetical protein F4811DRAFT_574630 [Daldinia bambusicola]